MIQPQEVVVAKLLPTIRARLARELLRSFRMKQIDVAKAMGITQAAVSHYNTQRFCEYHKSMGDIDPACTACFPAPPKP